VGQTFSRLESLDGFPDTFQEIERVDNPAERHRPEKVASNLD
jgi:hypothetical protein